MSIPSNNFILFAWRKGYAAGGMNDCCGNFTTAQYAIDFFEHSDHCKMMDQCNVFDCDKRMVVWEYNRKSFSIHKEAGE
jgi:hypothetical protein